MNKRRHAVLALDPGNTTGVAAGYVELQPTRKATLATLDNLKTTEVKGGWLEQSQKLAAIMWQFIYTANVEQQIPASNIHIVWEDFILRRRTEGGATGNLTSIWVMAATMGKFAGEVEGDPDDSEILSHVSYQQPSEAKNLASNERLKMYGLYERGSEHRRDGIRHLVLKVDKLIERLM